MKNKSTQRVYKWIADNPEKYKEQQRRYYEKTKERRNAELREQRLALKQSPEYVEAARIKKEKQSEARKARVSKYTRENPHVNREKARRHLARKARATPKWLTKQQVKTMQEIYKIAEEYTRTEGTEYQVDHIYPVGGKTVCGLHVPWNLQIITKDENIKKNRKTPEAFYGPKLKNILLEAGKVYAKAKKSQIF